MQARIDEETESSYLLVAPYGLIYDEVTSSSLAKALVSGTDVIDVGSSGLLIDTQSLEVHRALYNQSNRTDIKCIMQLNSVSAVTVSFFCVAII
jgi:ribulose-5-phosphate 4-epimerase/fuculose-1-phosphate aldolase